MFKRLAIAGLMLVVGVFSVGPAHSDSDMFSGKTITYIVATKPGGGYDTMGRLVAKYMEKHLTGSQIIVKNVPGAGHLIGAETIYSSEPDGLTIGTFNSGLIYSQLTGQVEGKLDLSKMSWIGKAAAEPRVVMVSAASDLKSIEDFKDPARQIKISANGKGSSGHFDTMMLAKSMGLNVRVIFGFEGTEGEMSLLRGEIDSVVGSRSSLQNYVDNGQARFLLEIGGKPGSITPQINYIALSEQAKSAVRLIESQAQFVRATVGPPGIPEEILKALRDAYMAALADPALLEEAAKMRIEIDAASGETVAEHIRAALVQPPEIITFMKSIMDE